MSNELEENIMIEKRYQRAQILMQGYWAGNIVPNSTIYPTWIEGTDCFWYQRDIESDQIHLTDCSHIFKWGKEYRIVNAKTISNIPAFDHRWLATALAKAVNKKVYESFLPITNVAMQLDSFDQVKEIRFTAFDKDWVFELHSKVLTETTKTYTSHESLLSPNGKLAIFTENHNLWLQDLVTGEKRPLTNDGEALNCYAAVGNAWGQEADTFSGIQARWSPDSQRILTVQRDSRQVLTLPVVEHVPRDGSLRPKVRHIRMAMQGDDHVPEYRLVSIEIETGRTQPANYRHLPIVRNSYGFFTSNLAWWGSDSVHAYFVDLQRDYKKCRVVEFNVRDGATRILFEETTETHISLMIEADEFPTIVPLIETNELIWFSERSGWAHLYLYDLDSGALKRSLTSGDWVVRNILFVNAKCREIFVQTMGRVPDFDPYYRDVVKINLDTSELTTLASGDYDFASVSALHHDHDTLLAKIVGRRDISAARGISYSGDFAVVTRSRADKAPVNLLFDRNGQEILVIERAELSALYASLSDQWRWPEPVKLLAADNKTDIYGLLYRPSDFSPDQSYPIVNHVFNSPELPRVSKGSFSNGAAFGRYYLEAAALAELGFMVVQIDGRGTPFRHKAFHDESYGWSELASNLDDHVSGIQQLAERYPYMDINRVGINSLGGGIGAVQALLHYPDFYKVGVGGMFLDSRLLPSSMWSDKFEGLSGTRPESQYPEAYANNLRGKLLMVHGMLDISTPPATTFRMIEALHKANKDFDLLLLPNLGHGLNSYVIRRAWDYLVKHLQKVNPPKNFNLMTIFDRL